jgi:hypothetical protein
VSGHRPAAEDRQGKSREFDAESAYEKGVIDARWMRKHLFSSQPLIVLGGAGAKEEPLELSERFALPAIGGRLDHERKDLAAPAIGQGLLHLPEPR